jgi:phosphoadenosine phosphosulfate reductase
VTGLRREQSDARAEVPFESTDEHGRTKFSPLADWSLQDVWNYVQLHEVPYNPLHDAFYPSIGCEPCTRAVSVGEDFRAGRWWWESEAAKECGLHASLSTVTEGSA